MTKKLLIDTDTNGAMKAMAHNVEMYVGKEYGFMVMVFPFGDNPDRVAHYISNCDRKDMIKALREKANVLEQGLDIQDTGSLQ